MRLIIEARLESAQTGATAAEATIVDVVERQDPDLGLTLAEGRALLAKVQSILVSQQTAGWMASQGISTIEAANAFMPTFIAEHNDRFAKLPRNTHDAHRTIRKDEDLNLIFSWRELRKLTRNLTLHYERKLYLLSDIPAHRQLIGKYLDVYQFPDGRIEIRTASTSLPYSEFDKLGELDQGQIVENKRLGHVLQVVQKVQVQRDNRVHSAPSTAHRRGGRLARVAKTPGTKTQRELNINDLAEAIATTVQRGTRKH